VKAVLEKTWLIYDYDWPGNVKELENFIEKAIIVASLEEQTSIQAEHIVELLNMPNIMPTALPETEMPEISSSHQLPTLKNYVNLCERRLIEEVLQKVKGDKNAAARILDIHISALYKKINKYELDKH
jgi:transcriptional regulator with PAS, ATPase and Fis domain